MIHSLEVISLILYSHNYIRITSMFNTITNKCFNLRALSFQHVDDNYLQLLSISIIGDKRLDQCMPLMVRINNNKIIIVSSKLSIESKETLGNLLSLFDDDKPLTLMRVRNYRYQLKHMCKYVSPTIKLFLTK